MRGLLHSNKLPPGCRAHDADVEEDDEDDVDLDKALLGAGKNGATPPYLIGVCDGVIDGDGVVPREEAVNAAPLEEEEEEEERSLEANFR